MEERYRHANSAVDESAADGQWYPIDVKGQFQVERNADSLARNASIAQNCAAQKIVHARSAPCDFFHRTDERTVSINCADVGCKKLRRDRRTLRRMDGAEDTSTDARRHDVLHGAIGGVGAWVAHKCGV